MKLEIDYKKITDSPYKKDTDSFFSFTEIEVEGFVDLISNMSESSYYVSGYRGVGKTSFIGKVEEELRKKENFVFIHVSVAKFDKYEILIRSFIRQFYFQFVENKAYEKYLDKDENISKLINELHLLNKHTFSEIKNEQTNINKSERTKIFTYEVDLKELVLFIVSIFVFVLSQNIVFPLYSAYEIILQIVCVFWAIMQLVKLGVSITKSDSSIKENRESEKTFYDDEIAEYKFNKLLKEFKMLDSQPIKPVFIIDELDKLSLKDAKKVLHLFKSTLLSGNANFIVVGGQELYYELYASNDCEDHVLSTLFSKKIHVKLKSSYELRDLLWKLVLNKELVITEEHKIAYEQYVNWLVFESKRIPRKFVSSIKDQLRFENGRAYLDVSEEYNRPAHTEIMYALDSVCNNIVDHPDPIKDYIVINLFSEIDNMLNMKTQIELDSYIENFN